MRRLRIVLACCLLVALGRCTSSGASSDGAASPDEVAGERAPVRSKPVVVLTRARLLGLWGDASDEARDHGRPWLRFDYDGTATGFDGCNETSGEWLLDTSAALVTTRMQAVSFRACPRTNERQLDVLRFDGQALTYQRADGRTRSIRRSTRRQGEMFLVRSDSGLLERVPAPIYPRMRLRTREAEARSSRSRC